MKQKITELGCEGFDHMAQQEAMTYKKYVKP